MGIFFDILEKLLFTKITGKLDLYTILSSSFKFVLVVIVLTLIYSMVRMITLDVKGTYKRKKIQQASLKLAHDVASFDFPIRNEYYLSGKTTIGRADDNNIIIKSRLLSKYQAEIIEHQGSYIIEDLNSTNGTYVNEMIITSPKELSSRDLITMGDIDFIFINGVDHEE